jgi:hypothetical protein
MRLSIFYDLANRALDDLVRGDINDPKADGIIDDVPRLSDNSSRLAVDDRSSSSSNVTLGFRRTQRIGSSLNAIPNWRDTSVRDRLGQRNLSRLAHPVSLEVEQSHRVFLSRP